MKKITAVALCIVFVLATIIPAGANEASDVDVSAMNLNCVSAILMEAETGKVLFEQNADRALPPASVTKIMTLLLVMEAVDSGKVKLTDTVTASAYAASMGGSQIYLKEGEQMPLLDMLKSVIIASANDCAVALAEHIAGSESVFVARMNARAKELGMENTNFENTNGLDDTAENHVCSARDIALMSRELIKHKTVLTYSSLWMDTVRDGQFGLTNTNRLVRFYKGATGLKTGSTAKAGFCVSATAQRYGMSLIAVIMGSKTRDERNEAAKTLLDWGFANYAFFTDDPKLPETVRTVGGVLSECKINADPFSCVVKKGSGNVKKEIVLPESLQAPIKQGDKIGSVKYTQNGEIIGELDICASENVEKIGFFDVLMRVFGVLFMR